MRRDNHAMNINQVRIINVLNFHEIDFIEIFYSHEKKMYNNNHVYIYVC